MKKYKFKLQSILFMAMVMIIFGVIFSFKKNITNNNSPKRATLVKNLVIGDVFYE